ncbi:hypothetical protein PCANC_07468 [Puccinia coronata f. sp. avenae]|uniref:DUF4211 domain-containing protein n=1 Tax=Puccinia coronata f. sp. avenae TaxID=200324 RepID=A0A2N5VTE2_9BASI|nr:hypothetical protein PCANC_07468 [Puccinia coronata f. sp. avenae]
MSQLTVTRKPVVSKQTCKVVIPLRPDLDRFKPSDGKILAFFPAEPLDDSKIAVDHERKRELDSLKPCSSTKKPKSNHSSPDPVVVERKPKINSTDSVKVERKPKITSPDSAKVERKPKITPPDSAVVERKPKISSSDSVVVERNPKITSLKSSSKPKKKNRRRPGTKDQSPDPDEDEDINDLALSDYSEPETKLRERGPKGKQKELAKLKKARKMINKKKALSKEINSKRIVPDSDGEIEVGAKGNGSNDKDSDDDSSNDSDEESSSGSGSEESSETTDEEQFIVDDMKTQAEMKRVKRQMDIHMPSHFRADKLDDISHFKIACNYLIHHMILPQIDWRKDTPEFDQSCKHMDDLIHTRATITLETSAWTVEFRRQLNTRPYITSSDYRHASKGCGACHVQTKFSKKILRITGKPYHPDTLNPEKQRKKSDRSDSDSENDSEDDNEDSSSSEIVEEDKQHKYKLQLLQIKKNSATVISGENCADRAVEYHFFKHWKFGLIKSLKDLVQPFRENHPLNKQYQHNERIPNPDLVRTIKREIRLMFQNLDDPSRSPIQGKSSLERLYDVFLARLNKVKRIYARA